MNKLVSVNEKRGMLSNIIDIKKCAIVIIFNYLTSNRLYDKFYDKIIYHITMTIIKF